MSQRYDKLSQHCDEVFQQFSVLSQQFGELKIEDSQLQKEKTGFEALARHRKHDLDNTKHGMGILKSSYKNLNKELEASKVCFCMHILYP